MESSGTRSPDHPRSSTPGLRPRPPKEKHNIRTARLEDLPCVKWETPRPREEEPKTQAHTPCLGHPPSISERVKGVAEGIDWADGLGA
jgi:hypothetical protein